MIEAGVKAGLVLAALSLVVLSGGPADGQAASGGNHQATYRVLPSDVALPAGVEPGRYRRIIQPFGNWTLVCDENLDERQKVCNVSQTIVDPNGEQALMWSLAATESGQPMMIVRTRPDLAGDRVTIAFAGLAEQIPVMIRECDQTACAGLLPVSPFLRRQIVAGTDAQITYSLRSGGIVTLAAPLQGLASALEGID